MTKLKCVGYHRWLMLLVTAFVIVYGVHGEGTLDSVFEDLLAGGAHSEVFICDVEWARWERVEGGWAERIGVDLEGVREPACGRGRGRTEGGGGGQAWPGPEGGVAAEACMRGQGGKG